MSEYPDNSTARAYTDSEGNLLTLRQMIRAEPEWAHSRIKRCEELEKEIIRLHQELAGKAF